MIGNLSTLSLLYLGENKESSFSLNFKGIFLIIKLNKNKIWLFSSWIWASNRGIIHDTPLLYGIFGYCSKQLYHKKKGYHFLYEKVI